ncbi:MAG TPA: peptidylprolyl isomerase [Candidatus Gracilibacteria bacterium]
MHTNLGEIQIKLYPKSAPKTVQNFIGLTRAGRYDNTTFHRVVKDFVIQGGDYENGDGTGGGSLWGREFEDEIDPQLSHVRGMVSMANHGPNTNGSQFFIVVKDTPRLDGAYSIFGQVVKGMGVVDQINQLPTDLFDKPLDSITIKSAVINLPGDQSDR